MSSPAVTATEQPYLFFGVVLPERAQISFESEVEFEQSESGWRGRVKISVVLNQVAVWVDSEHAWDIFTLRNIVKNIVGNELAMLGYLKGYAHDLEVTRVLNRSRGIDYVFGIDIPCLSRVSQPEELATSMSSLRGKASGRDGVFLLRSLRDLVSAMKEADDTGFYCYRAIESLRSHCAAIHGLMDADRSVQWRKFREVAGAEEPRLLAIKAAADPLRHGGLTTMDAAGREKLLLETWSVVDGYLMAL